MGYVKSSWALGALGFILPLAIGIILDDVHFQFGKDLHGTERTRVMRILISILVASVSFLSVGFIFNGWAYAWQFFLIIPMAAIIIFDKIRFTALAPFISVIIFFSVGYFFDLFHLSWLAFLLIPITAIIENA